MSNETTNHDTRQPPLWRLMLDGAIDASAVSWDRAVKRPAVALQVALLEEAAALLRQTIEPAPVEVVDEVAEPAVEAVEAEPVVERRARIARSGRGLQAEVEAVEAEPVVEEVEPEPEPEPVVEAAEPEPEPVKPKRKRRSRKSKVKADAPAEPPQVDPEIPASLQVGLDTAAGDGADFWQEPEG